MGKRFVLVLAAVVGLAAWAASAAYPWYSEVAASMDCSGTVTWTATAWSGPTPDSRVNPDVRVWVSYDNGGTYTQVGAGQFDAADNFSFSGSFSAGAASSVLVKVHEEANWPGGGGDVPGEPHYATATRPGGCPTTPPTGPPTGPPPPPRTGYCDESGTFWNLIVGQDTQPPYDQMHLRPADVNPQTGAEYCAPPTPPPPSRTGYCDESGTFWNLIVGQDTQPPYDQMHLRPADVNPQTGALYCATQTVVAGALKPAAPKVKAVHRVAKHATTKPKKHRARPKPHVRPATAHAKTLPFTK
jgi:hypothetical protein